MRPNARTRQSHARSGPHRPRRRWFWLSALLCIPVSGFWLHGQSTSILHSPHNLSAAGPGDIHASSEQQVCIFCHTPHNASPVQPLWNRDVSVDAYTVYSSNSLNAAPGQPTGTSKLCLSCHDGTIALGSVRSRDQQISMAGGMTTLAPGRSNLGTDLSDDHPVSFRYDDILVQRNPRLAAPGQLPAEIRLDHQQELQCTSCHNAHDNSYGRFLVMDNSESRLCKSCHTLSDTTVTGHIQCASCHTPHSAPSGPYLLRQETVSTTCLSCHAGSGGADDGPNVSSVGKYSQHDTNSAVNIVNHIPNNVVCADCHEPHTMHPGTAIAAPEISPRLGRIDGVNTAGIRIQQAQYEYEVCFKCHGDQSATQPRITRQVVQNNVRLKTAPSAVSYHPVQAQGRSNDVPSLVPGLSTSSMIYCTDCHASDTSRRAGGAGADGPHGSDNHSLLVARYETLTNTLESASAYALCYRCHDRTSIMTNQSFPMHREHIEDQRTPCSVCHDPHGVSTGTPTNHSRLMNFDVSVVQPDPVTQRLEFRDTGDRTGECYLSCHGVNHSPKSY
jgi:predicted CXXCH cytochrome family protein